MLKKLASLIAIIAALIGAQTAFAAVEINSADQAQLDGVDVHGPLAADTLFHQALNGGYDAVVAQYHDQGLGPLKLVAFDSGVNWTLGLPFVRTSPDHGTAYDIAGRGAASPSSMVSAIRLAGTVARRMQARRAIR